jgi:hypothetical protein
MNENIWSQKSAAHEPCIRGQAKYKEQKLHNLNTE